MIGPPPGKKEAIRPVEYARAAFVTVTNFESEGSRGSKLGIRPCRTLIKPWNFCDQKRQTRAGDTLGNA